MKRFGLTFKIWLAMFALVVLVLGLSAVFQSSMIEKIYLKQQADRILDRGNRFVQEYNELGSRAEVDQEVSALARALDATVLVIDPEGGVISWSAGRGMGRRGMGMMGGWMMHGLDVPFSREDIQAVWKGETVVKRGQNQFFGVDVILVAVPMAKSGGITGALLIYTPLAPIEANLRSIREAVLYSFFLGIAASTLLAFIFSRKVSGPILKIHSVARAMAGGNFSLQAQVRSGDELGMLADSINELSRQLKEKIRTIEKIDAARRGFVASVSHELRTPLTIMQGYTEALMDGVAEDEQQRRKYLLNIYEEAIRLGRLVDDLLDLRRLESGMISLRMERVNVSDIIENTGAKFEDTVSGKGIRVSVNLPEGSLLAAGDPDRLKQVIINLVDNAVRFSPRGSTVEVRGDLAGDEIKVSVKDEGPGITEDEQQLVWERFYKADSFKTGRDSGSGLGLAIARQIIELHGGRVGLDSSPGAGSTFWFTVPRF